MKFNRANLKIVSVVSRLLSVAVLLCAFATVIPLKALASYNFANSFGPTSENDSQVAPHTSSLSNEELANIILRNDDNFAYAELRRRGLSSVRSLVRILTNRNARLGTQIIVIQMLSDMRDPGSIDGLGERLLDGSVLVRGAAASALGKIRSRRSVDYLLRDLGDEGGPSRTSVPRALEALHNYVPLADLRSRLTGSNRKVQCGAVLALGQLRDRVCVSGIGSLLASGDKKLQLACIEALSEIATPTALSLIKQTRKSSDPELSDAATHALERVNSH